MKLCKILCVEDDQDDFDMIRDLIQKLSSEFENVCFVERARSVSLAETSSNIGHYDLFIVDQFLEGEELGSDFVRRLHEKHPEAPALLITGHTEVDGNSPFIAALDGSRFAFLNKAELQLSSLRDALASIGMPGFGDPE